MTGSDEVRVLGRDLAAYIAVAVLGAGVQMLVLDAGVSAGIAELPAFWLGWIAAWLHNFLWLRGVVFAGGSGGAVGQGSRYILAALVGLVVQTVVFAVLTSVAPVLIAGLAAVSASLPVTFALTRRWAFAIRGSG